MVVPQEEQSQWILEGQLLKHKMNKAVVIKGLLLILISIVLGAFVTHGLRDRLSVEQLTSFRVGVNYQMIGGLILLIFGLNWDKFKVHIKLPTNLFFAGICLFSFSIYALNLFSGSSISSYLWPITPIGGLLMIIALVIVIFTVIKSSK